jgi:uncharacterized spore protein YtfJ
MRPYPTKEAVMDVETGQRSELVEELLERVGQAVGQRAQASAVFGDPVEREGLTVIPVARSRFGFGGGGGTGGMPGKEGSGGGGGGGAIVTPVGFIEVRDGSAVFKRITTPTDWLALVGAGSLAVLAIKRLLD